MYILLKKKKKKINKILKDIFNPENILNSQKGREKMKKLLFLITWVFVSIITANAAPVGYQLLSPNNSGVKVYSAKRGGLIQYVIEAEVNKSNIYFSLVKFGRNKASISKYWNENSRDSKTIAIINGSFFGSKEDILAFPMKLRGSPYRSYFNERNWTFRSLAFNSLSSVAVFDGYSAPVFGAIQNYILLLHPSKDSKRAKEYIPRTFMAVKRVSNCSGPKNHCRVTHFYFFVDNYFRQSDMVNGIKQWGIREDDILMLDGGGSTQICSRHISPNCKDFGEARPVPHAIKISIKWYFFTI